MSSSEIQELFAKVVHLYAEKVEEEGAFPAVAPGAITATESMVATTALLRAVNVQLFELGLWQAWSQ